MALQHEIGLDPRFSSKGFYGHGLYLAEKAVYSNGTPGKEYCFKTSENGRQVRQLLLVRAVVGTCRDYGTTINRGHSVDDMVQGSGVLFDSVRGGPHRPSTSGTSGPGDCSSHMVVLYQLSQAYPEYLVTYVL